MFNWFKSKYFIGDTVITEDGFIGTIEAQRNHSVGYDSYERQSLICDNKRNDSKHRWVSNNNIAGKLSKAQEALFKKIFSEINVTKDKQMYDRNEVRSYITELHNKILGLHRGGQI